MLVDVRKGSLLSAPPAAKAAFAADRLRVQTNSDPNPDTTKHSTINDTTKPKTQRYWPKPPPKNISHNRRSSFQKIAFFAGTGPTRTNAAGGLRPASRVLAKQPQCLPHASPNSSPHLVEIGRSIGNQHLDSPHRTEIYKGCM